MRRNRIRTTRPVSVVGITLLAAFVLGGCSWSFGAPDPASAEGREIHELYRWFAAAAAGVGVFVIALIGYTLIRYRRRTDDIPRQTTYNIPWEVAYTVTPIVVVAVLFFFSVRTSQSLEERTEDPDVVVEVVGFQWQWQFRYQDEGVVVTGEPDRDPVLVLPLDRTTRLELVSTDVNHSFWVPEFLQKRDLIPNVDNAIDVTPTALGEFRGHCAEFCGLDHGRMNFTVRVVEPDEFAAWLGESREGSR